jgi:hypothetical protein
VTDTVPAKTLQPMLRNLLRDALEARGWAARRGGATILDAPETAVAPPLTFEWEILAEGAKYGGVRLSGWGLLRHAESASVVGGMPAEALPRSSASTPRERAESAFLDSVDSGSLAETAGHEGPRFRLGTWTVEAEDAAETAVAGLLELIDGPLVPWLHDRRSVEAVLDGPAADPARTGGRGGPTRAVAVLALLSDRVDVARGVLAGARPTTRDAPERLALFERLLAERFPAYGPLQRS